MEMIIPILVLAGLGLVFGIVLAAANRRFCVQVDPRTDKIFEKLPGANCGACGMAGCMGFAEGLIQGRCTLDKCALTEEGVRKDIAGILGVEARPKIKQTALLHCHGGRRVRDRFIYQGIEECVAANLVLGGQKECVYGCLGFGTCVTVCPFGAIKMSEDGLPVVDESKCKACNKCVLICPKKLFSLAPAAAKVYVACSSHDAGRDTKAVCPVGCIACGLCAKACSFDAIDVVDNLARIDYDKCTSCGECVKVCPTKCIRIKS